MNYGISAPKIIDKNIIFIFLLIGGIIFLNMVPFSALSPILILLLGIMLGLLIISIFAYDDFDFLFGFYLLGFGARIILSFLFYVVSFVLKSNYSPGFIFPNDGWCYSEQGLYISKFAERGIGITMETFLSDPNLIFISYGSTGRSGNITQYDFFTGFIYSITGHSPLSLFFISALAGSMAALFIYLIARELFSRKAARIASLFAFFWPSFILWSTQHLKEPMIAMFICVLLWTLFYSYRHFSPGFLLLSIVSAWALLKIGLPYLFMVTCAVLFASFFLSMKRLFKNRFIVMLFIGLLFFMAIFFFRDIILSYIAEKSSYSIEIDKSIFKFLDYHRSGGAYGNLAFLKDVDISSFGKLILFAPLGFLYAIFAPFPWQLGSVSQLMAVPETILFYILFPSTIKGIVFAYRNRFNQSILLLLIILIMLFFLGIVEGNIGTLFRHRSIIFHILFIFTAIGISLKNRTYKCEQRF